MPSMGDFLITIENTVEMIQSKVEVKTDWRIPAHVFITIFVAEEEGL